MTGKKIHVNKDGSLRLPREVMVALDIGPGSYLSFSLNKKTVLLKKMEFDPFKEAGKKPDPDAFEKILQRQKEGLADAEKEFKNLLKDPPEVKPEDRPDFWD